jgi:hypothetical protein
VCDDGFPWPGSLPPGWEYEWEDAVLSGITDGLV